jgi:hypothetical protein
MRRFTRGRRALEPHVGRCPRPVFALLAALVACGAPRADGTVSPAAAQTADGERQLIPAGYGTLRLDDITMSIRSDALLVKVTPLAESVIRLLAPDSYERYHSLAESRRKDAEAVTPGRRPELFLVSFFSYQADVDYQPEDVQISHQGRLMRAVKIIPITSNFGRQRLAQQENQTGIYVFDEPINYDLGMIVRYGLMENNGWSQIIPKLETERSRVRSKSGGG